MAEVEIMNRRPLNHFTLSNSSNGIFQRRPFGSSQTCPRTKMFQNPRSSPNSIDSGNLNRSNGGSTLDSYLNQVNEIEENLYLCGARGLSPATIQNLGISCIINVTIELPNVPYAGKSELSPIETLKIPIDDSPYANLGYYFDKTIEKINEHVKEGRRVLVHCVAGVSRSASIILAFLMKYRQMTLRRAFQHVKSRRPIIRPNPGFFRQLIDFEGRLFGKTSVKMVWNAAAGGNIPDLYESDYLNTMNFMAKYGCFHHHHGSNRVESSEPSTNTSIFNVRPWASGNLLKSRNNS